MASSKPVPACIDDIEKIALEKLDKNARDYYQSGANHEFSLQENREAFNRLRFRPRFLLRDVSKRNLKTTVLGHPIAFPIGISPSAMQKLAHVDGELATARAAGKMETVMILSTIATTSIEQLAEAAPDTLKWFQLYIYKDRQITEQLVKRAEKAGFKALVLTVDTPMFGTRLQDVRNKFTLPPHLTMANFDQTDLKATGIHTSETESGLAEYSKSLFDPSLTWKDVLWLKQITTLPIVIKGILTAEDAVLAVEYGAAAVMVSNHGARQLDGVPATIEVLPEIVKAVGGRCEVYLDGGVRTGTDVLKALALGARAVFIGRPNLWGLAYDGEAGASLVLQILRNELDIAMALSGCTSVSNITSALVVHQNYYSRL